MFDGAGWCLFPDNEFIMFFRNKIGHLPYVSFCGGVPIMWVDMPRDEFVAIRDSYIKSKLTDNDKIMPAYIESLKG